MAPDSSLQQRDTYHDAAFDLREAVEQQRPHLTDRQQMILHLIFDTAKTDTYPWDRDDQSPTPLDGENLRILGADYLNSAMDLMGQRLQDRLWEMGAGLPDVYHLGMLTAIEAEHGQRVRQNTISLQKLVWAFLKNPQAFEQELADSTYDARLGQAGLLDYLTIAASYPQTGVESIEVAKYTKPLDPRAITAQRHLLMTRFLKLQNENSDFSITPLTPEEERATRREVQLGELAETGNKATKSTIARVAFRGVTMSLKLRESYSLFPHSLDLGRTPKNIKSIGGVLVNIQPQGFSSYVAVDSTGSSS